MLKLIRDRDRYSRVLYYTLSLPTSIDSMYVCMYVCMWVIKNKAQCVLKHNVSVEKDNKSVEKQLGHACARLDSPRLA